MQTRVLKVDSISPDVDAIRVAATAIRHGELVAFPTETVYGLAADALNEEAVRKVFEAKGRPANNPLPVQVASVDDVAKLAADIPPSAQCLMEKFFPGPLTLVMRALPDVPDLVTAGTGNVGIRMPNHPVALALIREAGVPIVAPSANTSGQPPPTTAEEVLDYLGGKIEIIVDGGSTQLKVASTVLDVSVYPPKILRHGMITEEMLSACLEDIVT